MVTILAEILHLLNPEEQLPAILILISKIFILSGKFKNHTRRRVGFPLSPYAWGSVGGTLLLVA
jgi:hypothetical protein